MQTVREGGGASGKPHHPEVRIRPPEEDVGHWLLRSSETIDRRAQDGLKHYLLCKPCEEMLNEWETRFASEVYHPWCNREAVTIPYGPWMLKFAVSVSWRTLTCYMDYSKGKVTHTDDARNLIADALQTWRRFLFDKIPNPREYEQHMLLLGYMADASQMPALPANFNRFLTRGTHVNLAHSKGHPLFIFTKMGKVTLLGFLGIKYHRQWVGTKLHVEGGHVGGDITVPSQFGDYLVERAECLQREYDTMSAKQKDRIGKTFEKDLDRAADSESFQAMMVDVETFGMDQVFPKKDESEPEN